MAGSRGARASQDQTLNRVVAEERLNDPGLPRYELTTWRRYGLIAGMTAAAPGRDFSLRDPASREDRVKLWGDLCHHLEPGFKAAVVGRQVHGTSIVNHTSLPSEPWSVLDAVDGHLTTVPGILLTITVADCIPVYLAHPENGAIGLLHAGWRGIAGGIVESGIERLCELAGTPARTVLVHCGISICGPCYEVGPEVVREVLGRSASGKQSLDLRDAAARRARSAGAIQISLSSWCTAHDSPRFHSHRGSRGSAGRMAAYLGRPSAVSSQNGAVLTHRPETGGGGSPESV